MKRLILITLFTSLATYTLAQEPIIEFWDIAQTKKKSEQQIKNGMQDGKYTAWYENGEVAREGTFQKGKRMENSLFIIPAKK